MHIGHLRDSCIGDALVRILKKTGYNVEVHNYVDDLGNQLADTVVGLMNVPLAGDHVRFGDYCWDIYAGINKEYVLHPETVHKRTEILHALEEGNGNTAWLGSLVAERIVREHVEEMKNFGITYDLLVWESSILKEGFWSSAFALLEKTAVFVQETEGKLAGCWILKQSATEGTEADSEEHQKDKVLVRSNGILTYTAKDIAYHLWKFGLLDKNFSYSEFNAGVWTTGPSGGQMPFGKADMVVNVIDYRQEYPQAMVKQALEVLGYARQADKLHHVSYGVVSLSPASAAELGIDTSDGKTSYAMSGRQGIGIKVTELVQLMENTIEATRSDKNGLSSRLIATAAIRYYLLRFNLGTEIVFDFKQATEISGNTGVYLMYTYARAGSVLSKAAGMEAEAVLGASAGVTLKTDAMAVLAAGTVLDAGAAVDAVLAADADTAVDMVLAADAEPAAVPVADAAVDMVLAADAVPAAVPVADAAVDMVLAADAEPAAVPAADAEPVAASEPATAVPEFPAPLDKAELALLRHLSIWQDTLYGASIELTPIQSATTRILWPRCSITFTPPARFSKGTHPSSASVSGLLQNSRNCSAKCLRCLACRSRSGCDGGGSRL